MKVKFIGSADFTSKGINFVNGGIYDLKPEVIEYLKANFSNIEVLEEIKSEPKTTAKK